MATWTVHARDESLRDIRLVRDGFNLWAFLFPLLWMAAKGLSTVLLIALAAQLAITAGAIWFGLSDIDLLVLTLAIRLIAGFEGNDLVRWTWERRGWREAGIVPGDRRTDAEYRFYAKQPPREVPSLPPGPIPAMAPEPLGLFGGLAR